MGAFGERVFHVIERTPARLTEIVGIGPKRKAFVVAAWAQQKAVRAIMVFLQSHGVGAARAARIYKTYGDDALDRVRENPYRLALDVHGIGFKSADAIAQRLGIPVDSLIRAQAGVHHMLQEISGEGHCAAERERLVEGTARFLEISLSLVECAVEREVAEGKLVAEVIEGTECLYLAPLHRAEAEVAAHLLRLLAGEPTWDRIDGSKAIAWVEGKTRRALSASQRRAVERVINGKVSVITGGPGVGKTTVVNSILRILCAKRVRSVLCAPTGRAAKRLSESTGRKAKTIHRLLEFDPKRYRFKRGAHDPLRADNDYEKGVFNGDIGRVSDVDSDAGLVHIDFGGRRVEYKPGELDEVSLAYAITVHKSQGSEYAAVAIPLAVQHYPLLQRNLLYTAVTRGRTLVVIVGEPKALAMAVKSVRSTRRLTNLTARLARGTGAGQKSM